MSYKASLWSVVVMPAMIAPAVAAPSASVLQTSPDAQPDQVEVPIGEQSGGAQDIIVTAQKRAERIQDVPIAIRAVTGEQLIASGVTDVTALARVAPDLQITSEGIFTIPTIRGVSSRDVYITNDSAVSINIDGEYINRPIGLNASFFDIERIEVLRGPQGTLYGRNSTGGAINIFAVKPGREFEATINGEVGNYDAVTIQGALNIPLSETLALRVAGSHAERAGFRDNSPAPRGDNQNSEGLRASLLWEASPGLTAYLAGEYVDLDQTPGVLWGYAFSPSRPGWTPGQTPSDFVTELPRTGFPLEVQGTNRVKQYIARGRIDADLGLGTLTYNGGFRATRSSAFIPLNGYIPQELSDRQYAQDSDVQSHELRISGDFVGRGAWQVGGFYGVDDVFQESGFSLDFIPAFGDYDVRNYKSQSRALFAQVTYPFTDQLEMTVGGRQTWDEKSGTFLKYGFSPTRPTPGQPGASVFTFDENWDKFTWQVGVQWKPTADNLVYGKVSTGYKSGGVNVSNSFDPENLTAYEIGSKNSFLERKLKLNLSAFYYDYRDQQVSVLENIAIGAVTRNAGRSTIKGVETDLSYAFTRDDVLSITVNYLDARYDEFLGVEPVIAAPNRPVDYAGRRAPQSPQWTLVGGFEKTVRFQNGARITGSILSTYKSSYFFTPNNWLLEKQDGQSITDVSLTYHAPQGRFRIGAFVRNLEDSVVITSSTFLGNDINLWNFRFGARRTFGVQAGVRF